VVASLNCGSGRRHAGAVKSTLFNLRSWRRSVAFALELAGRARFAWLRYEDLVADPVAKLRELGTRLDLPTPHLPDRITDQQGDAWPGNSSFGPLSGIDPRPLSTWREQLPLPAVRYIEAATLPELKACGYAVELGIAEAEEVLRNSRDFAVERSELAEFSHDRPNLEAELERLVRVSLPPDETSEHWFLGRQAHRRLGEALLG
jgi:hypothetical protein